MEVFHKYFLSDDDDSRKSIMNHLLSLKVIPKSTRNWDQILRYYHFFDIAKDIAPVTKQFPDPLKTIVLLRNSRNYYTHYKSSSKNIWTNKQLVSINRQLHKLARVAIFKQLNIPDALINKLVGERGQVIFHNYEENEYSIEYLPKES
jgi:hypothetical protein